MGYTNKEQQRAFQREWLQKRRREWITEHGPCKCGSKRELEVDHVDPKKKVDHKVWSWSKVRRERELAKCQILCGRCHRRKTSAAMRERVKHGTSTMYDKCKCRCVKCRAWKSKVNAKRKVMGWV